MFTGYQNSSKNGPKINKKWSSPRCHTLYTKSFLFSSPGSSKTWFWLGGCAQIKASTISARAFKNVLNLIKRKPKTIFFGSQNHSKNWLIFRCSFLMLFGRPRCHFGTLLDLDRSQNRLRIAIFVTKIWYPKKRWYLENVHGASARAWFWRVRTMPKHTCFAWCKKHHFSKKCTAP